MGISPAVPFAIGLGLGLSSFALPQGPQPTGIPNQISAMRGIADSVGLQWLDGRLWAAGRRFKVEFEPDRLTYTPALGSRAPRNYPLGIQVESFGRGAARDSAPPGVLSADGLSARYERGQFVERYDIVPDGIKQSFVFDRLPAGSGDLVVRLRLDTELQPSVVGDTEEGIQFTAGDLGGVSIGEVVGIDGRGERVRGSMRYEEGVLDLVLPASFVDGAALPITLDPLFGSAFYAQQPLDNQDPDVAFDASEGLYLVAFERWFSSTDTDIHAQRLDRSGNLVGSLILIDTRLTNEINPAVANVNMRNTFVVVYTHSGDVYARSVAAYNAALSSSYVVTGFGGTEAAPDVGGEATTNHDGVVCVWDNVSSNGIQGRRISVSSTGALTFGSFASLASGGSQIVRGPRLPKSGGSAGRYLMVYQRDYTSESDVGGVLIDRDLNILHSSVAVTVATTDEDRPDVDGDGTNWVVAWQYSTTSSTRNRIVARTVFYSPVSTTAVLGTSARGISVTSENAIEASVAWVGNGTCLVGWREQVGTSTNRDLYVRAVDLFSCRDCEGLSPITLATTDDKSLQIASELSGGGFLERALIVWEESDRSSPYDGDIRARYWRTTDGGHGDSGGGCSGGGSNWATCARVDNPYFNVRVRGANPAALAWLIIGLERFGLPCGSCTLVPNPWTGFVITGATTDIQGNAAHNIPIPNTASLNGALFYTQWLVRGTGCSVTNSALSNAQTVIIQQ